jgi:hypothetical protein
VIACESRASYADGLSTKWFRFFFFSNENDEPPHIHVEKAGDYSKFWLQPDVELAWAKGIRRKDLKWLKAICEEHQKEFLEAWDEFFEALG